MTYEEYNKAMNKILEVQTLFRRIAFDTKGQRKERAMEGFEIIKETRAILNDLYGEVFDDEN